MKGKRKEVKEMAEEDRYSAAEFARRYKISEANLAEFCVKFNLSPETVLNREEFKRLLDEFRSAQAEEKTINEGKVPEKKEEHPKEERVSEDKRAFSRWAKEYESKYRLSKPKLTYVKGMSRLADEDEMTEQEFLALVNKYCFGQS